MLMTVVCTALSHGRAVIPACVDPAASAAISKRWVASRSCLLTIVVGSALSHGAGSVECCESTKRNVPLPFY